MAYKYSKQTGENVAKAVGIDLPISSKQSIEVCNFLRNRKLTVAKKLLEEVMRMDRPVPFKRFTGSVGHRKGPMASGRYPIKTCTNILKIIKSAEANAQNKGLSSNNLVLTHISANTGTRIQRYKRKGSRKAKMTHIEVILEEKKND